MQEGTFVVPPPHSPPVQINIALSGCAVQYAEMMQAVMFVLSSVFDLQKLLSVPLRYQQRSTYS